ncbi:hypothetical protein P5673_028777 [Acropora cervicornis]|uniref:Uncharacterized protein n=1 Tax=Acropora cervicornis TaxID=6130 RepID=A0AAD9PX38_ACRCE|nr:hypothetical protein P5673_028777 [Acropora cervicornis]
MRCCLQSWATYPFPEQLDDIPLRGGNTETSTEKWSLAARYDEIMFNRKKIYFGEEHTICCQVKWAQPRNLHSQRSEKPFGVFFAFQVIWTTKFAICTVSIATLLYQQNWEGTVFTAWYSLSQYIWSSSLLQGTWNCNRAISVISKRASYMKYTPSTREFSTSGAFGHQGSWIRVDAEKIEPDNVISASDSELNRLGISTIGDSISLRDLCSRAGPKSSWHTSETPPFGLLRSKEQYGPNPSDIRYDTFVLLIEKLSDTYPGNIFWNKCGVPSDDANE